MNHLKSRPFKNWTKIDPQCRFKNLTDGRFQIIAAFLRYTMSHPLFPQCFLVSLGFDLKSLHFFFSFFFIHFIQSHVHLVRLFLLLRLLLLLRRRLLLHMLRLGRYQRVSKVWNDFRNLRDSGVNILLHQVVDLHEGLDKAGVETAIGQKILAQAT